MTTLEGWCKWQAPAPGGDVLLDSLLVLASWALLSAPFTVAIAGLFYVLLRKRRDG